MTSQIPIIYGPNAWKSSLDSKIRLVKKWIRSVRAQGRFQYFRYPGSPTMRTTSRTRYKRMGREMNFQQYQFSFFVILSFSYQEIKWCSSTLRLYLSNRQHEFRWFQKINAPIIQQNNAQTQMVSLKNVLFPKKPIVKHSTNCELDLQNRFPW